MYTLFIAVPFFRKDSTVATVSGEWGRSLRLLRDSLEGRYGDLVVAAPEARDLNHLKLAQEPLDLDSRTEHIRFERIGDPTWRLRSFWKNYRYIRQRCREIARDSRVVHAGMNDVFKPYALTGFHAGVAAGCVTVFVIDTDIVLQMEQLSAGRSPLRRLKSWVYRNRYRRAAERAVAASDLALLKGSAVQARYARFGRRVEDFYDVSYDDADVISPEQLRQKLATFETGGHDTTPAADAGPTAKKSIAGDNVGSVIDLPLRLVSFGRLIPRKGVDHTLRAVASAIESGANLTLDVIGSGPESDRLTALATQLAIEDRVNFLGSIAYDNAFLERLRSYDIFVFTPLGEDTPRAIFDAMASGLAVVGYDIPFVKQVAAQADQRQPIPLGDIPAMAAVLTLLANDRKQLVEPVQAAADFARENSSQQWYRRRAQWTHAAVTAKKPLGPDDDR